MRNVTHRQTREPGVASRVASSARFKIPWWLALTAAVLVAPASVAQAADTQAPAATITTKRLSMDTALKLAQAAIAACRAQGLQVAVTVVDPGGHPQVVLRDSLAPDLSLAVSRQKAYTALSFNAPTSALAARFKGNLSVAKVDGVLPVAGGVPIHAAGATVGGVGVSGAPRGEMDEACARAGVDAVRFALETSD